MDFLNENTDWIPRPFLVQAPLESPLNMAHTFNRKAEALARRNKYDEAISSHCKAAECILQAMASCSCQPVLESLQRQHKAYLSQMERLSVKAQLLAKVEGVQWSATSVSRGTQTDNMHNLDTDNRLKMNEDYIYQIIRENDDMVRSQQKRLDKSEEQNQKLSALVKSPSDSACDQNRSGWRFLQEKSLREMDRVKFEDILKMNERLGKCVKGLLHELKTSHAEKKSMEEKLSGSGDSCLATESNTRIPSFVQPDLEKFYSEIRQSSPPI